jgi:hypothetical protein
MLSLRELQRNFGAALFDGAPETLLPWVSADGLDVESRIRIYRNNLREGFRKALVLEFPVIRRLVGVDYFHQLALLFQAHHPSRSGNLHHIGQRFPQFLEGLLGETRYSYLSDVAALEWAYLVSTGAPETAPLDPSVLLKFSPDTFPVLRFTLHPACRLVRSPYPVLRIWQVNQTEAAETEIIDLESGPDQILVRRGAEGVELRRIPEGDFALLTALTNGATLGDAFDAACHADPRFNVGEALGRAVALGVITQPRISRQASS